MLLATLFYNLFVILSFIGAFSFIVWFSTKIADFHFKRYKGAKDLYFIYGISFMLIYLFILIVLTKIYI